MDLGVSDLKDEIIATANNDYVNDLLTIGFGGISLIVFIIMFFQALLLKEVVGIALKTIFLVSLAAFVYFYFVK